MKENPLRHSETRSLNRDELIRSALEGKKAAIQGYDAILWKIRAGYVAVLYSGISLLVGEKTPIVASGAARNSVHPAAIAIFFLILGFSVSAFLLDLTYKCKKVRVIVAHDRLMYFALHNDTNDKSIEELLHISGETLVEKLHDKEFVSQYNQKLAWNLWRVLVPLYCATPVLAILVWIIAK